MASPQEPAGATPPGTDDTAQVATPAPIPNAGPARRGSRLREFLHVGPLERRLFAIVFVGLLPLALLSFATLLNNAQTQRQQLIRSAEDTMRATITAVDAEIRESAASLDALAISPRLEKDDLTGFREEARELLQRRPGWANIVLSDRQARQLVNPRLPPGSPLPARIDPASIDETVRTGNPGVGNIVFSPVINAYAFAVRIPIKRDGQVVYVLSAVVRPGVIQQLLKQQRIPEQGLVGVLDRHYNIVARSAKEDESVGKQASPGLVALLNEGRAGGWTTAKTLEGIDVYTVFQRSSATGWSAVIGLPADALDGPVRRSYLVLGGSLLFSMLLGIAAAFVIARTITGPMRKLERAAVAMGKGDAPDVPETELIELREAGLALSTAHVEREKLLRSERQARLREQEARLEAEKASRAKDEFLAMLGHELRNPLAAVTMAAAVLDHPDTSAESADEAKGIIRRQLRQLGRLTDDLLDTGRVLMGKISLQQEPVDLASVVRSALQTMDSTAQLKGHRLILAIDPVWARADAIRIEQVVSNLLANAVKYTPPDGSIRVTLEQVEGQAILRVKDTGLGLEADLIPRVFDLFVQGRRALDRSQGGLGIGLTLVRRLVELHGGHVEAKSDGPDRGSEFVVFLPAIEMPHTQPVAPAQVSSAPARNIVIVEDNHDARVSLRDLLELAGHRVHEAGDGQSGIDAVLREQPDVAFIDIGLPGMNGYAVARAVRARVNGAIHLVALTGYGQQEDMARGRLAGFDAYLIKPVDGAKLSELLARL